MGSLQHQWRDVNPPRQRVGCAEEEELKSPERGALVFALPPPAHMALAMSLHPPRPGFQPGRLGTGMGQAGGYKALLRVALPLWGLI